MAILQALSDSDGITCNRPHRAQASKEMERLPEAHLKALGNFRLWTRTMPTLLTTSLQMQRERGARFKGCIAQRKELACHHLFQPHAPGTTLPHPAHNWKSGESAFTFLRPKKIRGAVLSRGEVGKWWCVAYSLRGGLWL